MNKEKEQLILGNYYTLEMCRKRLNKYAHIYLNNIQVANRYNSVKKALEEQKTLKEDQLEKIKAQSAKIAFMKKAYSSKMQNISSEPITRASIKIAESELSAMQDTLHAIEEKITLLSHSIIALLQGQTENQVIDETNTAKEKYFNILVNYNKLLHEINILAGTAHAQKPAIIQKINPICLEQLLGEECEHEQH